MAFSRAITIICLHFLLLFAVNGWGDDSTATHPIHIIFDIDGTFLAGGKGHIPGSEVVINGDHFHLAQDVHLAFRYISEIPNVKIGFYSGSRTAVQKIQSVQIGPNKTALDLANGRVLNTPHWMIRIADKPEGTIFENFRKDLTLFESNLERIIIFEDEWSVLDEQFDNLVYIGKVFPDDAKNLEIVHAQNNFQDSAPHNSKAPEAIESSELAIWLSHHRAARMVGVVKLALEMSNQAQSSFASAARAANSNPLKATLYGLELIKNAKKRWCQDSLKSTLVF